MKQSYITQILVLGFMVVVGLPVASAQSLPAEGAIFRGVAAVTASVSDVKYASKKAIDTNFAPVTAVPTSGVNNNHLIVQPQSPLLISNGLAKIDTDSQHPRLPVSRMYEDFRGVLVLRDAHPVTDATVATRSTLVELVQAK